MKFKYFSQYTLKATSLILATVTNSNYETLSQQVIVNLAAEEGAALNLEALGPAQAPDLRVVQAQKCLLIPMMVAEHQ